MQTLLGNKYLSTCKPLLFSAELKPRGYYLDHIIFTKGNTYLSACKPLFFSAELKPRGYYLDHVIFTNMSHVYYLDL